MFTRLSEFIPPGLIGIMIHSREKLTAKEQAAQARFLAKLKIEKPKTEKSVIVAMVGLAGSGKSTVAQEFAIHLGATVIEGNSIRIELRKLGEGYKRARAIAENVCLEVIKRDGNVILDSDFVDLKRASLRDRIRKTGIRPVFIRTYCDFDVMVGRAMTAIYFNRPDDFFGGAPTKWHGSSQTKGASVKIREIWRRTPHHYRWVNRGGGKWLLKKLPFQVFAEIDTTDSDSWKQEVERCAKKLLDS